MEEENLEENKLKIAMLSWESLYSIRVGGLAEAVTNLSRALSDLGHEVHLFTRSDEGQFDYEFVDGIHVHRCSFPLSDNIIELADNMCGEIVTRIQDVEERTDSFDIIHGHDWMTVDALHNLGGQGYPCVLTYHSTEFARNGGVFGDWWEFHEISNKEWYGGYVSDIVTTVSSALKDELTWLYDIPESKIRVIPNGGRIDKYKKDVDPGEVKKRYGIHPLAPVILFVGRLEYQKGPDLLVEAVPHILDHRWDAKILIAGKGGMRDYLERMIEDLGVSDSVSLLGFIPDEEYKEVLNASDIVCIPSRNEPFGLVLFEAWDAEKAVVATNVGGLEENIENFVDGIKVYPYPESIAWGINYIIDDPEGVKKLGRRGKEKLESLTWSMVADDYEELYEELLGEE